MLALVIEFQMESYSSMKGGEFSHNISYSGIQYLRELDPNRRENDCNEYLCRNVKYDIVMNIHTQYHVSCNYRYNTTHIHAICVYGQCPCTSRCM